MASRTATALVGIAASLVLSLLLWRAFDTLAVFLFVPFVPILFGRHRSSERPVRTCPTCDFRSERQNVNYCPHDGSALRVVD